MPPCPPTVHSATSESAQSTCRNLHYVYLFSVRFSVFPAMSVRSETKFFRNIGVFPLWITLWRMCITLCNVEKKPDYGNLFGYHNPILFAYNFQSLDIVTNYYLFSRRFPGKQHFSTIASQFRRVLITVCNLSETSCNRHQRKQRRRFLMHCAPIRVFRVFRGTSAAFSAAHRTSPKSPECRSPADRRACTRRISRTPRAALRASCRA